MGVSVRPVGGAHRQREVVPGAGRPPGHDGVRGAGRLRLSTLSAPAMLGAMVAGQRDPTALAEMAEGKMRGKIPQLGEALDGNLTDAHARLVPQMLQRLGRVEQALA